ncbi:phage holin family protein [Candidatus Nomurabacteria bacterium]|nr:phage holin family protein [Candidatus Nomurabacteria bacterium]
MLVKALVHIIATAAALVVMTRMVPGISVEGWYSALIVAVVWGLLGVTIRPILGLLTLPINIITFGLFSFVLNALLFWFVASIIQGFDVAGFVPALIASAILALVSYAVGMLF